MSNARNLANLLGAGTTIATASTIADDAITAAKIDDDGTGFTFGDVTTGALTATGATTGIVSFDKLTLDGSSVATVTVNSAVSSSATIVVDGVSGTIAVGMVVNVSDTTVRSIIDAPSETAVSVDDTLTITAVASQTSFTVSEAVSIADNVVLILRADENSKMVLDASAASTDVGEEILFEDATSDGSITTDNFSTNTGIDQKFAYTLANTVAVNSDGGAVTFNIAQSLVKAWVHAHQHDAQDSFNVASQTDTGTGDYTFTFTNSFASASNCPAASNQSTRNGQGIYTAPSTASFRINPSNASGASADYNTSTLIAGDLA